MVPHDATQTVGYFIEWEGVKFFLMTDAGRVTREALEYASCADTIVFESNYDPDLLENGPYPPPLKRRIAGPNGHLSNPDCAGLLPHLVSHGTEKIMLAHLSEHNNTPEIARDTALARLDRPDRVCVASPSEVVAF